MIDPMGGVKGGEIVGRGFDAATRGLIHHNLGVRGVGVEVEGATVDEEEVAGEYRVRRLSPLNVVGGALLGAGLVMGVICKCTMELDAESPPTSFSDVMAGAEVTA